MKLSRKLLFMFLVICIVFQFSTGSIQAASTPKLNKTTVNMSTVDTVTLKVLNTNKKVTWSSSNKKVAKVNSKGKVTPIWFGKAVITAKVGSKTLKCNVNVLNEDVWYSEESTYSLSIMPISNKKARVRITIDNGNKLISSGDMIANYSDEGVFTFIKQGKYNISGGYTIVDDNGESVCILLVSDSDNDIFITDVELLDIKIQNS